MAYSQEIIQVISEAIALIPTSATLTAAPTFYTKELFSFNQLTEASYPLILLDRPLQDKAKYGLGADDMAYDLSFYVLAACIDVNADFETIKEPALVLAQEMKRGLIKKLNGFVGSLGRIDFLNTSTTTEIPENKKIDDNPCGLLVQIPIMYHSFSSIC